MFNSFFKRKNETFSQYLERLNYALKRRVIPSVRRMYRLDSLVGPFGFWDQLQEYQLGFLKQMGFAPHHTLLDIACGPLQGGIAYIDYLQSGKYVGVDIRPQPLIEGHKQIFEKQLLKKNPYLILSDSFGENELVGRSFDYLWASQVLYHFDDELIDKLFKHISAHMHEDSIFYGDILEPASKVSADSHWGGFSFHLHSMDFLRDVAKKHKLNIDNLGPIEQFGYPSEISLKANHMLQIRKAD